MTKTVKTVCPYCGVGCGVDVRIDGDDISVSPDRDHPSNLGRLCSKGSALADTLDLKGRLLNPYIGNKQVSWDQSLELVANRFVQIIEESGPEAVAFYVSGQLLTEDYYVANKLMKGFIGSANIDTNSRLCMSSAVAAHKRAFGADAVPCSYEDLEQAQLIVITGGNTAWCHPVLYQRIKLAKTRNPDLRIVLIDPRATATADIADIHLPLRPGTDATLFNGLLATLDHAGKADKAFLSNVDGVEDAVAEAHRTAPNIESVAAQCGLEFSAVRQFFEWYTDTEQVITVFSQGINQSSSGVDKGNALINCHLYTGRIGKPGMGPFSFTGQPNAMGGREVGGLANMLASHLELDNPDHRQLVQDYWQSPGMADKPGLKAVDMFRAVKDGRIRALWVMATNPAVSLPESDLAREALDACEFLVVSDCMAETDTSLFADVRLPASTWGEKSGTVTNSERRISRMRSFMEHPGEVKPDWWIIKEVATRMGFSSEFSYAHERDIFKEYAQMTGFRPEVERDLRLDGLASLNEAEYEELQPVQWPVSPDGQGTKRLFSDGQFHTPSKKARMLAITPRPPEHSVSDRFPLILNTGRVRDHWHTLTRTGKSARLSAHTYEPYVEVHPGDALIYGLKDDSLAELSGHAGSFVVRIRISESQQPGCVFVPMHWNNQFSSGSRVNRVLLSTTDPVSGQPEFKQNPVSLEPWQPKWHGFMLSRRELSMDHGGYWNRSLAAGDIWRYELACKTAPDDWTDYSRKLLCTTDEGVNWIEYLDSSSGRYRAARLVDGQLESCIFIGPDHELPPREWLIGLFEQDPLDDVSRRSLLSGKPGAGQKDAGAVVCSCFGVGINTIVEAIRTQGLVTPEAIGEALQAGTNCGSCVPELKSIIAANQPA